MLNFCDFIQVFVFTTNHHLNMVNPCDSCEKKANDAETGATVNLSKKILSSAILTLGLLPL